MKYRSRIFILLAITMIVIGAVSRAMFVEIAEWPSGHHQLTISSDGRDRKVVLYVPPQYDKTKAVPLVVMLHGMGGTAMNAYKETSWSTKGEKETFIVVYPEATRPNPNAAPSLRNNPQAWNDGSGRFHGSRMIQQMNANTNSQTKNFNSVTGRAEGTRPMPTAPPGNAIPIHRDRTKQCTGVAVRAR